ncbi:RAQPRD family integrative conjugative element protein [Endothiovibrio diazotrophicus]
MRRLAPLLFCVFPFLPAHADWEGERAALARLQHELEALTPLIDEAEAQRDPRLREAVNYDKLRYELRLITRGIEDTRQRRIPPHMEAIDGAYLR